MCSVVSARDHGVGEKVALRCILHCVAALCRSVALSLCLSVALSVSLAKAHSLTHSLIHTHYALQVLRTFPEAVYALLQLAFSLSDAHGHFAEAERCTPPSPSSTSTSSTGSDGVSEDNSHAGHGEGDGEVCVYARVMQEVCLCLASQTLPTEHALVCLLWLCKMCRVASTRTATTATTAAITTSLHRVHDPLTALAAHSDRRVRVACVACVRALVASPLTSDALAMDLTAILFARTQDTDTHVQRAARAAAAALPAGIAAAVSEQLLATAPPTLQRTVTQFTLSSGAACTWVAAPGCMAHVINDIVRRATCATNTASTHSSSGSSGSSGSKTHDNATGAEGANIHPGTSPNTLAPVHASLSQPGITRLSKLFSTHVLSHLNAHHASSGGSGVHHQREAAAGGVAMERSAAAFADRWLAAAGHSSALLEHWALLCLAVHTVRSRLHTPLGDGWAAVQPLVAPLTDTARRQLESSGAVAAWALRAWRAMAGAQRAVQKGKREEEEEEEEEGGGFVLPTPGRGTLVNSSSSSMNTNTDRNGDGWGAEGLQSAVHQQEAVVQLLMLFDALERQLLLAFGGCVLFPPAPATTRLFFHTKQFHPRAWLQRFRAHVLVASSSSALPSSTIAHGTERLRQLLDWLRSSRPEQVRPLVLQVEKTALFVVRAAVDAGMPHFIAGVRAWIRAAVPAAFALELDSGRWLPFLTACELEARGAVDDAVQEYGRVAFAGWLSLVRRANTQMQAPRAPHDDDNDDNDDDDDDGGGGGGGATTCHVDVRLAGLDCLKSLGLDATQPGSLSLDRIDPDSLEFVTRRLLSLSSTLGDWQRFQCWCVCTCLCARACVCLMMSKL